MALPPVSVLPLVAFRWLVVVPLFWLAAKAGLSTPQPTLSRKAWRRINDTNARIEHEQRAQIAAHRETWQRVD